MRRQVMLKMGRVMHVVVQVGHAQLQRKWRHVRAKLDVTRAMIMELGYRSWTGGCQGAYPAGFTDMGSSSG